MIPVVEQDACQFRACVAYVWNKDGNFDYFCNMEMVELSLIEEDSYRKELHELIRQHYLYTGSKLARILLDNWNHYVDQFIQVVPILLFTIWRFTIYYF